MACLIKRGKSKYWYLKWRQKGKNGESKQFLRSTKTEDRGEAEEQLRALQATLDGRAKREALEGILQAAGAVDIQREVRLTELWQFYQMHADVSGSERQVRDRENKLKHFLEWLGTKHPEAVTLNEVTMRVAGEFWRWMEQDGKSPRTRNNILSQLNVVWGSIQNAAGLQVNPWSTIKRDQGGGQRYQHLSIENIEALVNKALTFKESRLDDGFWPVAVLMGLYTGLREGDIAQLSWDELRFGEGIVELIPNKTAKWGDDRIAVHSLSAPWVAWLPEKPENGKGYVWPKAAASSKTLGKALPGEFKELCRLAGIEVERAPKKGERRKRAVKLVTFHSLRHSFVTHLLQSGLVTSKDLVAQGNWSTAALVEGTYNHAKREAAIRAAEKVATALPELNIGKTVV